MKTSNVFAGSPALLIVCAVFAVQAADLAKDYPSRPIRLIMPNAPGSSADTMGRIAATKLGEALGQQIVVDNRAGAGGVLGIEIGKSRHPCGIPQGGAGGAGRDGKTGESDRPESRMTSAAQVQSIDPSLWSIAERKMQWQ